jgi:hypothetical protein
MALALFCAVVTAIRFLPFRVSTTLIVFGDRGIGIPVAVDVAGRPLRAEQRGHQRVCVAHGELARRAAEQDLRTRPGKPRTDWLTVPPLLVEPSPMSMLVPERLTRGSCRQLRRLGITPPADIGGKLHFACSRAAVPATGRSVCRPERGTWLRTSGTTNALLTLRALDIAIETHVTSAIHRLEVRVMTAQGMRDVSIVDRVARW